MFKYDITAWVKDKTGYYKDTRQVTPVVVYANNAKEAIAKMMEVLPEKTSNSSNYDWVYAINSITELLEEKNNA